MEQLKKYILSQVAQQKLSKDEAKSLLLELADSGKQQMRDVAIIGMACRFPMADAPEAFWQMLRRGVNCVRDFPRSRVKDFEHILLNPYYTEYLIGDAIKPEDISTLHSKGGYLEEIDKFDAEFFGIPPNEANYLDPHHRIALQIAWEALEDAGYGGDAVIGSRTGVYMGKDGTNHSFYKNNSDNNPLQVTGSWESLMVSRISHLFDFRGPCLLIDTACSAGLISVHLAIQALLAGECDMAIAGGINLSLLGELDPRQQRDGVNLDNVESTDGMIRTFDAKANGTVWGEGAGVLVLKPLFKALTDRDPIRAVIKASAINNDGASNSITAPRVETQESVIVDAWTKAGIPPESISYIEAHGTGTALGDPIEVKGLSDAFRRYTSRRQFCAVGSLKTNLGHLVGASGVASLMKVVKSIEHKEIAPTIHFQVPNPYINFVDSPLYVSDVLQPWETGGYPRRAALSSFGFSRTNCHMVIEEAPELESVKGEQPYYCLTISAKNEQVFDDYVRRYEQFLTEAKWNLADLCYTSNIGRGHYEYRAVLMAKDERELGGMLKQLRQAKERTLQQPHLYKGYYTVVSEKKRERAEGEISRNDRVKLSQQATTILRQYIEGGAADEALLQEVCRLYVQGADVDWHLFYRVEKRRRIPIPVYPLQRKRYWAKPKISQIKMQPQEELHPLVEREVFTASDEKCFETVFRVDRHWVLSDHLILNNAVLPGTSYLEMVRFAATRVFGEHSLAFRDVFFLTPLVVEEGEGVEVRLTLKPSGDNERQFAFAVASRGGSNEWVPHVEGVIGMATAVPERNRIDIESLKQQADVVQDPVDGETDNNVFTFGPHWRNVRAMWKQGSDCLARLQLDKSLRHELEVFRLHPALLDNAVNLTSQDTGETYLPFMYKKLHVYAPLTDNLYTHIRLNKDKEGRGETQSYDIDLADEHGRILAEIRGYTIKRMQDVSFLNQGEAGQCLTMNWILRETGETAAEPYVGSWALIATPGDRAQALADALQARNIDVEVFYLGSDPHKGGADLYPPDQHGLESILDAAEQSGVTGLLFATDYTLNDAEKAQLLNGHDVFQSRRRVGVDALFQLCKCLLQRKTKTIQRLKVLVREAWAIDHSEAYTTPLSASTAALARVIGQEYQHLTVDILDVAGNVHVDALVDEFFSGNGLRGLRPSGVYVEQLQAQRIDPAEYPRLEPNGVYVITGGLGGLGLAVAGHLAELGQANVILLGRKTLAAVEEWPALAEKEGDKQTELYRKLVTLKERLRSLEYISADVADYAAMQKVGQQIKEMYGDVTGIFHAAGVAGDGFLMFKDDEQFRAVLAPKLDGSFNLLNLLPVNEDSFFALFSSITALTGGEGQGDYSAANAFLDSFADAGRLSGRKMVAINWPSWEQVGMAIDFGLDQQESLFTPIRVRDGLQWLERLIALPHSRIVPAALNPAVVAREEANLPFLLVPELKANFTAYERMAGNRDAVVEEVAVKGTDLPTETQRILANAFGTLLGLNEIDIYTSFQDMGGNSLMTTQLLKLIENHFPNTVDISDIFSYPSVYELAEYIDGKMQKVAVESRPASGASDNMNEELLDLIEQELEGTEYLDSFIERFKEGAKDVN